MGDFKMGNIIGCSIAIGFIAIYLGFWGIEINTYISLITMAAALYAAGTAFGIHKKLHAISEELQDFKNEMAEKLNSTQSMIERIDENIPELPIVEKNMFDHWEDLDKNKY